MVERLCAPFWHMTAAPYRDRSVSLMPAHDTFVLTEPIRRLRSRSHEIIKPISSAHEAQGKVLRSRSRYPLHSFDRHPVVAVNRRRLEPLLQLDTLARSGLACHRGGGGPLARSVRPASTPSLAGSSGALKARAPGRRRNYHVSRKDPFPKPWGAGLTPGRGPCHADHLWPTPQLAPATAPVGPGASARAPHEAGRPVGCATRTGVDPDGIQLPRFYPPGEEHGAAPGHLPAPGPVLGGCRVSVVVLQETADATAGLDHMQVYTCGKKLLPTFPNCSMPVKSMAKA